MIDRFNIESELMAKKMPLVKAVTRLIDESEWYFDVGATVAEDVNLDTAWEECKDMIPKIQNYHFSLKKVFTAIDRSDNKDELIEEAELAITDHHDYQRCIDETAIVIAKYISPEVAKQCNFCASMSDGWFSIK